MNNDDRLNLYKQCFDIYGEESQLRQLQEECAELIVAVNHMIRKNNIDTRQNFIEELADVSIVLEQFVNESVSNEQFEIIRNNKLYRLKNRLESYNEKG